MGKFSSQRKRHLILVMACLAILCSSCASTVLRPISEAKKDQSGTYDGTWEVTRGKSAGLQYGPGNWQFTCDTSSGRSGVINVADGVASLSFDGQKHNAFVNSSGQFRFEVPLKTVATARGGSDSSVDRGAMTMILGGSLTDKDGFRTWGIAEFANNGCTAPLTFEKR